MRYRQVQPGMRTVYVIAHPACPTVYFGSTKWSIDVRFAFHLYYLEHGRHSNPGLQRAYKRLGRPEGWQVHQLAFLPVAEATALEKALIEQDGEVYNELLNPRVCRRIHKQITQETIDAALKLLAAGEHGYAVAQKLRISTASVTAIKQGVLHKARGGRS